MFTVIAGVNGGGKKADRPILFGGQQGIGGNARRKLGTRINLRVFSAYEQPENACSVGFFPPLLPQLRGSAAEFDVHTVRWQRFQFERDFARCSQTSGFVYSGDDGHSGVSFFCHKNTVGFQILSEG